MTDEKYQEMMQKLHQAGKITSGSGDMPPPQDELIRRINAAKEAGLIRDVRPVEIQDPRKEIPKRVMREETFYGPYKEYAESAARARKNTKELQALGVPYEVLQPLALRKQEEAFKIHNMNRDKQAPLRNAPQFIGHSDESMGLDPEKFTKKTWNPADYIGYSEGKPEVMAKIADDLRLRAEQERVLGSESESELSEEENKMRLKMQLAERLGMDPSLVDIGVSKAKEHYATDRSKELTQRLNLGLRNGQPVLGEDDEDLLNNALMKKPEDMTPREKMLVELMGAE